VRVAYLQDEKLLALVSPEEFDFVRPEQRLPFTLLVDNPNNQEASENVSHFRWECFNHYRVTLTPGKSLAKYKLEMGKVDVFGDLILMAPLTKKSWFSRTQGLFSNQARDINLVSFIITFPQNH